MNRFAPALALALLVPACLDQTGDTDDVATTDQASTLINMCAVSGPNATSSISFGTDSFVRPAGTVNPSGTGNCDCKNHQLYAYLYGDAVADAHYPNCRAWTLVDFTVGGQQLGYKLGAEVGTWNLSNGQTECNNSELQVEVQQYDYSTSSYNTIWSYNMAPIWTGSSCVGPSLMSPQGYVLSGKYRVRARARRGLFENNHGYETVTVRGIPAT